MLFAKLKVEFGWIAESRDYGRDEKYCMAVSTSTYLNKSWAATCVYERLNVILFG